MLHNHKDFIAEAKPDERAPRRSQLVRVDLIDAAGLTRPAVIRNISTTGIGGVIPSHHLTKGETVCIIFAEGCSAQGEVAWAEGEKFGIRLHSDLDLAAVLKLVQSKLAASSPGSDWEVRRLHRVPSQHPQLESLRRI